MASIPVSEGDAQQITTMEWILVFCSKYLNAFTFNLVILLERICPVAILQCADTNIGMNQDGWDGVKIGNSLRYLLTGGLLRKSQHLCTLKSDTKEGRRMCNTCQDALVQD